MECRMLAYTKISRNLFQNKGGVGKVEISQNFDQNKGPWAEICPLFTPSGAAAMAPDCCSVGFASPETTGRTRSRSGIASRQCSPVAGGRLHSPETPLCCCLARAQAFFFTRRCPRKPSSILLAAREFVRSGGTFRSSARNMRAPAGNVSLEIWG